MSTEIRIEQISFQQNNCKKDVHQTAMKKTIFIILLLSLNAFAQQSFDIINASEKFDVKIEVAQCDESFCEGKATYTLYEKGKDKVFQKFDVENSVIQLGDDQKPLANITLLYDEQSAVTFDDFNFDGEKDLALNDGNNAGYGSPSYQVYLFSKKYNKFVQSPAFTELAQGNLGMFEVNTEKKMLFTFTKSGCCWHQTQGFSVVKNRPFKSYEETEDAQGGEFVKVTTKTLVKGKWKTSVKRKKIEDDQ